MSTSRSPCGYAAESAVAVYDWRRAPALSALFVARRAFLPEAQAQWAEVWRRRLADVRIRALECYAETCLGLRGAELPGAERAGRELVEAAPFRESGHLLLMRALAASGPTWRRPSRRTNACESCCGMNSSQPQLRLCRTSTSGFSVSCLQAFAKVWSRPLQRCRRMLIFHDNGKQTHQQPIGPR